jgi:hypothetical protein
MTALFINWPLKDGMSALSLAYGVGTILIAWATVQLRSRTAYTCPTCGSKRPDGHSEECPWRHRP